jgi:hypothetical protein
MSKHTTKKQLDTTHWITHFLNGRYFNWWRVGPLIILFHISAYLRSVFS